MSNLLRSIAIAFLLTVTSSAYAHSHLSYVYNRDANTMVVFIQEGQTHDGVCALVSTTGLTPELVEVAVMLGSSPVYTPCE